jgi:hypothetical protein
MDIAVDLSEYQAGFPMYVENVVVSRMEIFFTYERIRTTILPIWPLGQKAYVLCSWTSDDSISCCPKASDGTEKARFASTLR